MIEFFKKIKQIIPYSLGLKIFLGSIIGILTGAKIFGYIAEYITYVYSMGYGARVSIEGLDLLNPVASLLSLLISILASLFFTGVIFLLRNFPTKLLRRTYKMFNTVVEAIEDSKKVSEKIYNILITTLLVIGVIILPIMVILISYFGENQNNSIQEIILQQLPPILFIMFFASLVVTYFKRTLISWIALYTTLTLIVSSIFLISNIDNYEKFLRLSRYGGGIEISLERNCYKLENCNKNIRGFLFLKTNKNFIVYDTLNTNFIEVPNKDVMKIMYKKNPEWFLPRWEFN